MKFITEKSSILEVTVPSAGFASKKNTIASIEGILFKTVSESMCEICAFDLEKGMKASFECQVIEDGCYIINATKFIQIIKAMPDGKIEIAVDPKSLRCKITGGKAKFELQALNGKDFPDLPELRGDKGFTMKQSDLKTLIQKTIFAVYVNHSRPELRGLNISVKNNRITSVSCDGNRISYYSKECDIENVGTSDLDFQIIIHGDTVNELMRFISDTDNTIKINVARKHAIFFIGKFDLSLNHFSRASTLL